MDVERSEEMGESMIPSSFLSKTSTWRFGVVGEDNEITVRIVRMVGEDNDSLLPKTSTWRFAVVGEDNEVTVRMVRMARMMRMVVSTANIILFYYYLLFYYYFFFT